MPPIKLLPDRRRTIGPADPRGTHWVRVTLLCWMAFWLAAIGALAAADYDLASASFLGGSGATDRVVGARVLSDGTLALAANLSADARPGGLSPVLLNGAGASSAGALIRLGADGRKVLSVTRLAAQVNDLAVDSSDRLYVAAHDQGVLQVSPAGNTLLWRQAESSGRYAWRVDAGGDGHCVALDTTTADVTSATPASVGVNVYDAAGSLVSSSGGYRNTLDVCLDSASQSVFLCGWRQATDNTAGGPVQISYIQARGYDGAQKWLAYDWDTTPGSARYLNKPESNMADTRALRCSVGGDGKLYVAFQCAGGNHLFRYDPFDITKAASIVGGDMWHAFYNTRSEHKTFFARYEPATGAYLRGQQFTGRLGATNNYPGNTVIPNGDIRADAAGRVYLGGAAAWGLPMPPHPKYVAVAGQTVFNPYPPFSDASYLGGSWFLVMSADFSKRLYCTRLTSSGGTLALDARILPNSPGGAANIVFAGRTTSATETYTLAALQPAWAGATPDGTLTQGWFGVAAPLSGGTTSPTVGTGLDNGVPSLLFTYRRDLALSGLTFQVEASGDLETWSTRPDVLVGTSPQGDFWRASLPLNTASSGGLCFLRLRVTR